MKSIVRLLVPLGLACLCITFSGCEGRRFERHANLVGSPTANPLAEWWITPTPWPDAMATPLHATRGDELDPRCPPNFIVVADATAVAEGVGIVGAEIPGLGLQDYSTVAEAFAGPGTLCSLLPVDPFSGSPVNQCTNGPGDHSGLPFGFRKVSENQWKVLGLLCAANVADEDSHGGSNNVLLTIRIDRYLATPGAEAAFHWEAETMPSEFDLYGPSSIQFKRTSVTRRDDQCKNGAEARLEAGFDRGALELIGEDRYFEVRGATVDDVCKIEEYSLLVRRRNIVARVDLSMEFDSPDQVELVGRLVDFATQLDRNIEAAAQQ